MVDNSLAKQYRSSAKRAFVFLILAAMAAFGKAIMDFLVRA